MDLEDHISDLIPHTAATPATHGRAWVSPRAHGYSPEIPLVASRGLEKDCLSMSSHWNIATNGPQRLLPVMDLEDNVSDSISHAIVAPVTHRQAHVSPRAHGFPLDISIVATGFLDKNSSNMNPQCNTATNGTTRSFGPTDLEDRISDLIAHTATTLMTHNQAYVSPRAHG